ncbi:MAG: YhbY family RNA-binding protein [Legionellaceae bacterium]
MKPSERQVLKAKAHNLKPVILMGAKGLTQAVLDETDIALLTHELIKIKINGQEKDDRQLTATAICDKLHAELIQMIGSMAIIYRKNIS